MTHMYQDFYNFMNEDKYIFIYQFYSNNGWENKTS